MPKKILVVDDDELTVHLLRSRLEDSGHTVVEAMTGREAIEQALAEKPDVLIMDILLPDMQGSDSVKKMQSNADIPEMKVIFLSGIISKLDESGQQVQIDGNFYPAIAKPVDFIQLAELIA